MLRVHTSFSGSQGAPYYNIMHFMPTSTEDLAAAQAAITATKNFWNSFVTTWLPGFSYVVSGPVDVVTPATGKITGQFLGTSQSAVGTAAVQDPLPFQTQGLIKWTTGDYVNGRAVVGRTNIPGMLEGFSNGAPMGIMLTNSTAAITAIVTTPTLVDFCVWQRPRKVRPVNPDLPDRDGSSHLVQAGALNGKWAVLRSRRD